MLFRIGFLSVGWMDVLDILVVTFLFYKLYLVMRGTIAIQIFVGLLVIFATSYVARTINLQALSAILNTLTEFWVIAFIILFQPELRRLLLMLGRGRISSGFFKEDVVPTITHIADACEEMARAQTGALLVIVRSTGVRMIAESGIQLNAEVSKQLLVSIFNTKSPLHDGAVVINGREIMAARCTLPLTAQLQIDGFIMGMRHRSAVGISEQADVIAIAVSEETGLISIARDGKLLRGVSREELVGHLVRELRINVKGVIESVFKNSEAEVVK